MFKFIAVHVVWVVLLLFHIFPINKKKIFFASFNGKKYFCNPKYVFLDMYNKFPQLNYIWCLNQHSPELSKYANVTTVKFKTFRWIYHMLTAKVIIYNNHLPIFLPYRKKQIAINTWHGGGAYKKVGLAEYVQNNRNHWRTKILEILFHDSAHNTTYFISSSKGFSDVTHESLHIPYDKLLPVGMPRNDILVNGKDAAFLETIKTKLDISPNFGLVLYAPTFRGGHSYEKSQAIIELDVNRLKTALKERFKRDYICLFRGHPSFPNNLHCDDALDVSAYEDMQELLLVADVLITDYSSSIWDFGLTSKPCFLFAPDVDFYIQERGFYTPINQWPYPLAKTNEELCGNIYKFDKTEYDAKVQKHYEDLGSYEQGTATAQVTRLLQEILK